MQNNRVSKAELKAKTTEQSEQIQRLGKTVIATERGKPVLEVNVCPGLDRHARESLRGTVIRYADPTAPVDMVWGAAV